MATMKVKGFEAYLSQLRKVAGTTTQACKKAVKAGAGVVADEIRAGLVHETLAVYDGVALGAFYAKVPTYISETQKQGLIDGFGITPIRNRKGLIEAKVGFDGFNNVKTERWPEGQPNVTIARACESGTSLTVKQPFIRPGFDRAKKRALQAMEDEITTEIEKAMN